MTQEEFRAQVASGHVRTCFQEAINTMHRGLCEVMEAMGPVFARLAALAGDEDDKRLIAIAEDLFVDIDGLEKKLLQRFDELVVDALASTTGGESDTAEEVER